MTEGGSSFVALVANLGADPAVAAQSVGGAWASFAARGAVGSTGLKGDTGAQGPQGTQGPQGLQGQGGSAGATGASGTTGQGAFSVTSNGSLSLTTPGSLFWVPGLSIVATVTSATSAVVISSDGGVQCNSDGGGLAVAVDIYLFVDNASVPTLQRRIYAVNMYIVPNITNWSFSYAVGGLAPGTHTFKVAAALVASNGAPAVVSSGMANPLRATLTAAVINK